MNVIGIPASVDSSGLIGHEAYYDILVNHILSKEKGLVLCLNYNSLLENAKIVQLETLPTLIFYNRFPTFEKYITELRHTYRRRVKLAIERFKKIRKEQTQCSLFTETHYQLYLAIMKRTKTKLEILSFDFFSKLPDDFILTSYYAEKNLITWHITCTFKNVYSFLFGGIDYELRDTYEAYYNNLLGIICEGIEKGSSILNLGQTAELPKMRVGGQMIKKRMFIYHNNWLLRLLFTLFRNQLGYKAKQSNLKVFKNENFIH
jgi:hypothetical protein